LLDRFKAAYVNREETVAIYTKLVLEQSLPKKRPLEVSKLEMKLEAIVALIEVFTHVATFADAQEDDWYKITLVELGALEWCLDVLYSLKLI
jgi:hypothetical protein